MYKVSKVTVRDGYRLDLVFQDGTRGKVSLAHLAGKGVFSLWNEYAEFRKVKIGPAGELVWADKIDLCPDSLYLKVTGKAPEDVFHGLKHELTHA